MAAAGTVMAETGHWAGRYVRERACSVQQERSIYAGSGSTICHRAVHARLCCPCWEMYCLDWTIMPLRLGSFWTTPPSADRPATSICTDTLLWFIQPALDMTPRCRQAAGGANTVATTASSPLNTEHNRTTPASASAPPCSLHLFSSPCFAPSASPHIPGEPQHPPFARTDSQLPGTHTARAHAETSDC